VLLVQGKTEEEGRKQVNDTMEVVSYLSGKDLFYAIAASEVVLCRSGYSSLMDLAVMGKPAILVPTPGQPEQEYLAKRCLEKNWAVVQQQDQLAIEKALELAHRENRKFPISQNVETGKLETTIGRFLRDIP
jgi:UDP-N-acetylglucosamine:LPS N-acetylglucosamine transferase